MRINVVLTLTKFYQWNIDGPLMDHLKAINGDEWPYLIDHRALKCFMLAQTHDYQFSRLSSLQGFNATSYLGSRSMQHIFPLRWRTTTVMARKANSKSWKTVDSLDHAWIFHGLSMGGVSHGITESFYRIQNPGRVVKGLRA